MNILNYVMANPNTNIARQYGVQYSYLDLIPTLEEFLDALGLEETEENINAYVEAMGGY